MSARARQTLRSPALWVFVVSAAALHLGVVDRWRPSWDAAIYVTLADSLADGHGFTYLGYDFGKYPPGLPLLLAPIDVVAGRSFLLMRSLMVVAAAAAIAAAFLLLRRTAGLPVALACAVLTAGSQALWEESVFILSDLPFMAFTLAGLLAAERFREHGARRDLALCALAVVAATAMRLVGLALAAAVALTLHDARARFTHLARARHAAVILGPALLLVVGWSVYTDTRPSPFPADLPEGSSYCRELLSAQWRLPDSPPIEIGGLLGRVADNAAYYENVIVTVLASSTGIPPPLRHAVVALWLLGLGLALRRRRGPAEIFTVFYAVVYLVWPANEPRFVVVLLPLLWHQALQPLLAVVRGLGRRFARPGAADPAGAERWTLAAVTILLLALNAQDVWRLVRSEHEVPYLKGPIADLEQAMIWVRDHLPADAVVVTDRAPIAHVMSGRKVLAIPRFDDRARLVDAMRRLGTTHVVATGYVWSLRCLNPLIAAEPQRFRERHRVGDVVVYDVVLPR